MPRELSAILATLLLSTRALAASYPVSGRWTDDYSSEKGPAKECGARRMEFAGERRASIPSAARPTIASSR